MYHQNPRVRDAQNPYRTGVLIGNCWEDKFGMQLAEEPVSVTILILQIFTRTICFCFQKSGHTGISENKAGLSLANSTAVYESQPKTRQMIQAEAEFQEYDSNMRDMRHGIKNHIFFGHGPTQDTFEKRDMATTNDMMFEKRVGIESAINPNTFEGDAGRTRSQQQVNVRGNDLPSMFGKSGTAAGETKPKHYN